MVHRVGAAVHSDAEAGAEQQANFSLEPKCFLSEDVATGIERPGQALGDIPRRAPSASEVAKSGTVTMTGPA